MRWASAAAASLAVIAVGVVATTLIARELGGSGKAVGAAVSRGSAGAFVGRRGPIAFAAGACVGFAPVGRWNGRTVFLDPGHGGRDPGAVAFVSGRPVSEKSLTLALGRRALEPLRRRGYRVVLSRVDGSSVARLRPADVQGRLLTPTGIRRDIEARNLCANAVGADVLVAIHLNSFADPGVGGTETIYNRNRPFRGRSLRLATLLQRAVSKALARAGWGVSDRGVFTDRAAGGTPLTRQAAAYGQLLELGPADPPWFRYPSLMPGVVVEPLFLTDPVEARLALSPRVQLAIAQGLVNGIASYFTATRTP